jgi:hypothetical protein
MVEVGAAVPCLGGGGNVGWVQARRMKVGRERAESAAGRAHARRDAGVQGAARGRARCAARSLLAGAEPLAVALLRLRPRLHDDPWGRGKRGEEKRGGTRGFRGCLAVQQRRAQAIPPPRRATAAAKEARGACVRARGPPPVVHLVAGRRGAARRAAGLLGVVAAPAARGAALGGAGRRARQGGARWAAGGGAGKRAAPAS